MYLERHRLLIFCLFMLINFYIAICKFLSFIRQNCTVSRAITLVTIWINRIICFAAKEIFLALKRVSASYFLRSTSSCKCLKISKDFSHNNSLAISTFQDLSLVSSMELRLLLFINQVFLVNEPLVYDMDIRVV